MIYLFIFSIIMFLCIPTMAVDFLVNNSGLQHNEKKKEINSAMFLCRAFGVFLIVMLLYYWKKFIVIPLTILLELSVDNVKTKLVLSFIIVLFGLIYYLFFWFSKDNNYAFYKYENLNKALKYSFVTELACLILLIFIGITSGYFWKTIMIITICNCYLLPIADSRKIIIKKSNGMIFDDTIIFTQFYSPEEITNIEKNENSVIIFVETKKIIIKNISEEVLDELNNKYWKKKV